MASYKLRFRSAGILICLIGILGTNSLAEAIELGLENEPGHAWVHRRAKGDGLAGTFAIVLRIDPNLNAQGRLWYFPAMNAAGTKYIQSSKSIAVNFTIETKGQGLRARQEVKFKKLDGTEVGRMTLYDGRSIKRANPGQMKKARESQRLVFRWNATFAATLMSSAPGKNAGADTYTVNCDDPPDDAPMEEEAIPEPQIDDTLPDMDVDP